MVKIAIPALNLTSLARDSLSPSPVSDPHRGQYGLKPHATPPVTLRQIPLTPSTQNHAQAMLQRLESAFNPSVRSAGWAERYKDSGGYAGKFWEAVVMASSQLTSRAHTTVFGFLSGLARRRRSIAMDAQDPAAHLFGRWRNSTASDGLQTPIGGVYATDRSVRSFLPRFLAGSKGPFDCCIQDDSLGERPIWTILGHLPGGEIAELTTWDGACDPPRWWHATPTPAITDHLQTLFAKAVTHPSHDLPGLMAHVARLQWWLAHACVFCRGSAGISDMAAAALLWHHGWKRPAPCLETSIDLAALCSPDEDVFVKDYVNLFEHQPTPHGLLTNRDAKLLATLVP